MVEAAESACQLSVIGNALTHSLVVPFTARQDCQKLRLRGILVFRVGRYDSANPRSCPGRSLPRYTAAAQTNAPKS